MAELLTYESVSVSDSGNSETSGSVRVRDVVFVSLVSVSLLSDPVAVTEAVTRSMPEEKSVAESCVVTDSVTTSLATPGATLVYDPVVVSDSGNINKFGPVKVTDYIQVNLSSSGPVNLSRAIVDVCPVSEFENHSLIPARAEVSDSVAVYDDCGQDNPIAVREYVLAVLGDAEFLRLLDEGVAVTESVTPVLYQVILQASISDSVAVSESQVENIENVYSTVDDSIAVTDSVQAVLFDEALTTDAQFDEIPVTDSVSNTLTPIYPSIQSNSVIVSDFAVGFLGAKENQTRTTIDAVGVSDHVIAQYSALSVLVYDNVSVSDRKKNKSKNRWWRYLWAWRG